MDWVEVLKVVGILVGAIVTFFGVRRAEPRLRPRSRLKADLEILNLLKSSEPSYRIVKEHVDTAITKVYRLPSQQEGYKRPRVHNWSDLVLGIICFPGFTFWTWYLVRDGFSWWAIPTGFFAFAAIGWILIAFEEKRVPPPSNAGTANDKTEQSSGGQ